MPKTLLRKIIDEMALHSDTRPLLRVTGTGEPFMMPGLTEELVAASADKGVRVGIITNGSLVTPDRSARLLDAGVEAIEFSVDAADKQTYEEIRNGLNFDVLLGNVEFMIEHRERIGGKTKILASVVENPKVIDPPAVEAFWRGRVDGVIMRKYLTYGQLSEDAYSSETYLPPESRVPCPYPFERMVVLASGNVTFCNFDVYDSIFMGNAAKDTIAAIWRGERFEAWRQLVLAKRFEEVSLCAKCSDWKYKSWTHNYFKVLDKASQSVKKKC